MRRFISSISVLSLLGVCLLAAMVLLFGDLVGLSSQRARTAVACTLVAIWSIAAVVALVRNARAGKRFEHMFRSLFDRAVITASPEQRGEVALLRKQLLEAIATIKKSNLGHTRGKAALYELPWYMVIGHPAAGKSSLIQHSELSFPLAGSSGDAVRGVGGTRNCDWFFSTEGILIDTAGRYATQQEDRAEWLELLKLLKSHRPRNPINGILVTISLPELVQFRSEGFSEYARQIRARIGEIDRVFDRKVPVYLLVTKLDLLGGFRQFFHHVPEEHRHQAWGAAFEISSDGGGDRSSVAREFDLLADGLSELGSSGMNRGIRGFENPALFAFPIEFKSLKGALDRFIELLFEEDPYHTKPMLRGLYFTSALQDGLPKIPAGERVSKRFELAKSGFPVTPQPDSQPHFVRPLFRDVIFPDQHLIAHQMRGILSRARWATTIAGLALLTISVSAWSWSYLKNHQITDGSLREVQLFETDDLLDRLTRINFVQARLEQIALFDADGTPPEMRLGLYKGGELSSRLKTIYAEEAATQVVAPLKYYLEELLKKPLALSAEVGRDQNDYSEQVSNYYQLLKTYLMLGDKDQIDQEFLSRQLHRHWLPLLAARNPDADPDALKPYAEQMIAYYTANFSETHVPYLAVDDALVKQARFALKTTMRKLPTNERTFNNIIETANRKFAAIGTADLLGDGEGDLINGSQMVQGAYTRAAWEGYVSEAIEAASNGSMKESDWVLAADDNDNEITDEEIDANRTYLLARYKTLYAQEWRQFLDNISVARFRGVDDAIAKLERLSDFSLSPISRLLAAVGHQTAWDLQATGTPSEAPHDLKAALVSRLLPESPSAKRDAPPGHEGELEQQFQLLSQLTHESGGPATLAPYCNALAKVQRQLQSIKTSGNGGKAAEAMVRATNNSRSELANISQLIDSTLSGRADAEMKSSMKKLFARPLGYSYAVALPLASSEINRIWQRNVYSEWQVLSERYPFSVSEGDATVEDIHAFLEENTGTLDRFLNEDLDGLVVRRGERLIPRQWGGMSIPFNRKFLAAIQQAIYLRDSIARSSGSGRFELQPVPSPGISEVVLEVDGQIQRYRNGPQLWSTLAWPGATDRHGAKITVTTFNGHSTTVENISGRLGWARLIAKADRQALSASTTELKWTVPNPDPGKVEPIVVRFNFRPIGGTNPLALTRLSELSLPKTAVN